MNLNGESFVNLTFTKDKCVFVSHFLRVGFLHVRSASATACRLWMATFPFISIENVRFNVKCLLVDYEQEEFSG